MLHQNFFDYLPTEIKAHIYYFAVVSYNKNYHLVMLPDLCIVSSEIYTIMNTYIKPRIFARVTFSSGINRRRELFMNKNVLPFAKTINIHGCCAITDGIFNSATQLKSLNISFPTENITQDGISRLTNLTYLSLDQTSICFTDRMLKNLTNLTSLNLMTTASQNCYTNSILHLTKLTELGFKENRIHIDELPFYSNITKLAIVANTTITDKILEGLPSLKMLNLVGIDKSPITDKGLSTLTKCTHLWLSNYYHADSGHSSKITDRGISTMAQLKSLSINKTLFTDESLKGLTNLTNLTIGRNPNVTSEGLNACPSLKYVRVSVNFSEKFKSTTNYAVVLQRF